MWVWAALYGSGGLLSGKIKGSWNGAHRVMQQLLISFRWPSVIIWDGDVKVDWCRTIPEHRKQDIQYSAYR